MIESGPVNLEIVFEHRMYQPVTALALMFSALLVDARHQRVILPGVMAVAIACVFAIWTHERNATWADPLAFARDVADKSPNKARVHHNLANALQDAGHSEAALEAIQKAIALDPESGRPRRLHGRILMELGRADEAVVAFRAALRFAPLNVRTLLGLGEALSASGADEEAFEMYMQKGVEFGRSGAPYNAMPFLRRAVDLRPGDADARSDAGSRASGARTRPVRS